MVGGEERWFGRERHRDRAGPQLSQAAQARRLGAEIGRILAAQRPHQHPDIAPARQDHRPDAGQAAAHGPGDIREARAIHPVEGEVQHRRGGRIDQRREGAGGAVKLGEAGIAAGRVEARRLDQDADLQQIGIRIGHVGHHPGGRRPALIGAADRRQMVEGTGEAGEHRLWIADPRPLDLEMPGRVGAGPVQVAAAHRAGGDHPAEGLACHRRRGRVDRIGIRRRAATGGIGQPHAEFVVAAIAQRHRIGAGAGIGQCRGPRRPAQQHFVIRGGDQRAAGPAGEKDRQPELAGKRSWGEPRRCPRHRMRGSPHRRP